MNDSYSAYLMFKPAGGVWIALSQIDWTYKASATNDAITGWALDDGNVLPNPGNATTLAGANAFPKWDGRASTVRIRHK